MSQEFRIDRLRNREEITIVPKPLLNSAVIEDIGLLVVKTHRLT